ncbi:N-acetyltransferase [Gracilibacillus marinus]|uniref:N-acetyltransferase n=1 Tax=Gracilibacillus marinus TaxID=630535 RepID=A0ABV8VWP9_9BACI
MIRKSTKADMDILMKIWLDTNIKAHHFIEESYWQKNYTKVKEILPSAELYVYEYDGDVIAFIGIMEKYIAGLFVKEDFQTNGYGKALLNYVKQSKEELFLQVYKENKQAIHFYQREGFEINKEQIDPNTNNIEYVMSWNNRLADEEK